MSTETFRGYVAPWECDEMGHMNIQFYAAKFAQSLGHHLHGLGFSPAFSIGPGTRAPGVTALHMRFHKELHASDLAAATGEVTEGPRLTHLMRNDETGALAATASFTLMPLEVKDPQPLPDEAAPRSVNAELLSEGAITSGLMRTNLSAVTSHECDAAGVLNLRGYFSRLSDAQGHMWRLAGLGRQEQKARGLATATVELNFSFFTPLKNEELVEIKTGLHIAGEKVLHYRHCYFNAATGAAIAQADGIGLLFDKSTRRAIALPEDIRERARGRT